MKRGRISVMAIGLAMSLGWMGIAPAQTTQRVSVGSGGVEANDESDIAAVSADGRFVAFESQASNLVPGDTNDRTDVFVTDRQTGAVTRVSVSTAGVEGNGISLRPDISADGRYVTFSSYASNLVTNDTNGTVPDIFLHDRQTGVTTRLSVATDGSDHTIGSHQPAMSANGRFVAFASYGPLEPADTNGVQDVYVRDTWLDTTSRVSVSSAGEQGNNESSLASISGDGRFIGFASRADNLVARDTNQSRDAFVHDRQTGVTERISVTTSGLECNGASYRAALSFDGSLVIFDTDATNVVPGDTDDERDLFAHDRNTGQVWQVSVNSFGHDLSDYCADQEISADGTTVVFRTEAVEADGANGFSQIFAHRLHTGETRLVSRTAGDAPGNSDSGLPVITADASLVVFYSYATDLVGDDTNGVSDVFVRQGIAYSPWIDLGNGLAGSAESILFIDGILTASGQLQFELVDGPANAAGLAVLGFQRIDLPVFGGTLVPSTDVMIPITLNAAGQWSLTQSLPATLPIGVSVWLQVVLVDPGAPKGLSATNARTAMSE